MKPKILFLKDNLELCEDFKEGEIFELFSEQRTHYIIYHNKIFYGAYKECCKLIEEDSKEC